MPDEILVEAITEATIEAGVAGALMGGDAASTTKAPVSETLCSNCHTRLRGQYCHHCGQVADTYHRPVWALFAEILEGYLGLDGRFWRTIPALLFHPGKVTLQYLRGIRQPYMTPIRLFLLSSLIFFLVFALLTSGQHFTGIDGVKPGTSDALVQARDEITALQGDPARDDDAAQGLKLAQAGIDAVDRELSRQQGGTSPEASSNSLRQEIICGLRETLLGEDPPTALCLAQKKAQKQKDRLAAKADQDSKNESPDTGDGVAFRPALSTDTEGENADVSINATDFQHATSLKTRRFLVDNLETALNDPDQYRASLGRWAPRLAFVLAPAYGLLLALSFFWRRDLFVYDHMVVALHFHSFLFLFLLVLIALGLWVDTGLALVLFLLWSNYYLYRVMRKVYGTSRAGAVVRVFILDLLYSVLLLLAFASLLVLGIVFV